MFGLRRRIEKLEEQQAATHAVVQDISQYLGLLTTTTYETPQRPVRAATVDHFGHRKLADRLVTERRFAFNAGDWTIRPTEDGRWSFVVDGDGSQSISGTRSTLDKAARAVAIEVIRRQIGLLTTPTITGSDQ